MVCAGDHYRLAFLGGKRCLIQPVIDCNLCAALALNHKLIEMNVAATFAGLRQIPRAIKTCVP